MGKKILVGMVLLGALIVFALATFYIENWQVYLKKGYMIKARFPTAQGLIEGDEVLIAGVGVGRVDSLQVDTSGKAAALPVTITTWIQQGVAVRAQDTAEIETRSIFGGAFMSITPGDPAAPLLRDGDELRNSKVQPNITQLMAKADQALDAAGETFKGAREAVENIRSITSRLEKGDSTLGKLLTDREAYDKLTATMDSVKGAFDDIQKVATEAREGKGLMARMMNDEQLANDVQAFARDAREVAANLKQLSADLESGKGTVGKLFKDEQLYGDLTTTVSEARKAFEGLQKLADEAREGKGLVAKLLNDEQLAQDMDRISRDIRTFAETMAKLSGQIEGSTVGKLLSDDLAYKKLIEVLDNLNATAQALASRQGTLGMLIRDRKLYDQLTGAAESVQKLLDDYREQSPVLTFAGAIFGAF